MHKEAKSSYFDMPALDVSVAFSQATLASNFPPCTSDYYQFADLLTPEEQAIKMKVRECMEKEIAPIMTKYWEKAEFPFEIIPKIVALHIAGGTIKVLLLQQKLPELMQAALHSFWCIEPPLILRIES